MMDPVLPYKLQTSVVSPRSSRQARDVEMAAFLVLLQLQLLLQPPVTTPLCGKWD
jgi:hypothetical protein